jgi:hypothetical protein
MALDARAFNENPRSPILLQRNSEELNGGSPDLFAARNESIVEKFLR